MISQIKPDLYCLTKSLYGYCLDHHFRDRIYHSKHHENPLQTQWWPNSGRAYTLVLATTPLNIIITWLCGLCVAKAVACQRKHSAYNCIQTNGGKDKMADNLQTTLKYIFLKETGLYSDSNTTKVCIAGPFANINMSTLPQAMARAEKAPSHYLVQC